MRKLIACVGFALLGSPWIIWEFVSRRMKARAEPRPTMQSHMPACPECGEALDDPHFHAGHVFWPTADPELVIETWA